MSRTIDRLIAGLAFGLGAQVSLGNDAFAASAHRDLRESFEEALGRASSGRISGDVLDLTALSVAAPLARLNRKLIPEWRAEGALGLGFERIRTGEFLAEEGNSSSRRPIPWDYIQDGCSSRAALASELLEAFGFRRPAKLFVFGELVFQRSEAEVASWWYHVAPVVTHQGTVYVLDPAVEPRRPLPIEDWVGRITLAPSEATLSVCNPFAYEPSSHCYLSGPEVESFAREDALVYSDASGPEILSQNRP